jgi:hypothetical protein
MNPTAKAKYTISKLEALGWKIQKHANGPHTTQLWKRHPTQTRCHCNDNKDLIVQFNVMNLNDHLSLSLQVFGELADETWVVLDNYSLGQDYEQALTKIPRLLKTWEAIAAPFPPEGA